MPPRPVDLRRHAYVKVYVNGDDVTDTLDPYLISVQVIDKSDDNDTCSLELDDRDGRLAIPPDKGFLQVFMGWQAFGPRVPPVAPLTGADTELPWEGAPSLVFQGTVVSAESAFSRTPGRRLFIEAEGTDIHSSVKTKLFRSMGEGEVRDSNGELQGGVTDAQGITLRQALTEAGQLVGHKVYISEEMGNIRRDNWSIMGESFRAWATRIAQEVGGDAKFGFDASGSPALFFYKKGEAGTLFEMPEAGTVGIEAWWGINLIAWRIKPFTARPQFKQSKSEWFDLVNAKWKNVTQDIGGELPFGRSEATNSLPAAAPNRQVGEQFNQAMERGSRFDRGTGWVQINGEPQARARRQLTIVGARPGVDGSYQISEAEHNYTRSGGYTTRCTLKQPNIDPTWYKSTWDQGQAPNE